jgi:hypothetical protein
MTTPTEKKAREVAPCDCGSATRDGQHVSLCRYVKVFAALNEVYAAGLAAQGQGWRPTHRHYKGNLYQKLGEAWHSETQELLTVCRNENGELWACHKAMFEDFVQVRDGRPCITEVRRFMPLPVPPAAPEATERKEVMHHTGPVSVAHKTVPQATDASPGAAPPLVTDEMVEAAVQGYGPTPGQPKSIALAMRRAISAALLARKEGRG